MSNVLSLGFDKWRTSETPVGKRLPYLRHLDAITVVTDSGDLIQFVELRGMSVETLDDDELNYRKQLRATALRAVAQPGLEIYHHVVRERVEVSMSGTFGDSFSNLLNEAWSQHISTRNLLTNSLYLILLQRPATITGFRFWDPTPKLQDLHTQLRALNAIREAIVATLAPYGARTASTYEGDFGLCSGPCEILASILNGNRQPILLPSGRIGDALPNARLIFGFDAMESRSASIDTARYSAALSLKDYPARSAPGMLDGLLRLPFELTLTESFAFLDAQVALQRISTVLRRMTSAASDAKSLQSELGAAKDDAAAGRVAYGNHHLTVFVHAASLPELNRAVASARAAIAESGAVAVREDVNLEASFWGQFPGNSRFIARSAMVSTTNFASLVSLHNHSAGKAHGNHWGPAVTTLETTANGPYSFNWHVGDLGNFTVIGPSGSGKTVLLTFLLAQAQKFKPRTIYFDKDRGAEVFIRAIGGHYDVLRPGEPAGFNPLKLPDSNSNRAFLADWLGCLLHDANQPLDSDDRMLIAEAVAANFDQSVEYRQLRFLKQLFSGHKRPHRGDLAARLSQWCDGGEHAWLFDNADDHLNFDVDRYGFDMTGLLDMPTVRTPTMMYLFHRIEQLLDGAPTIIVIDEAWKALDDAVFVAKLRDWEKTIRKRNGIVGFCTQSASDAIDSKISSAIIEQAATHIFLPNARAREQDYIDGFGLSPHEFELVRSLPDVSRCFLVKQSDHSVVARLDLGSKSDLVKVLAGTERSVRELDRIRSETGDDPISWLPKFAGLTCVVPAA